MQFNVLALDARQQVVALTLEAANDTLAADQARAKGLSVVSVEAKGFRLGLPRRSVRFPVMLFSAELVSLLDAGLNLVEALQTLAEKERRAEGQQVLSQILAAIHRGEPLSQAIAGLPEQFSPLYVATIKAAERSGNVREALGRYIAYQEEIDRVKKKIVSASIYPAILMGVGGLVLAFLMFYVVPRFARVYEDTAGTRQICTLSHARTSGRDTAYSAPPIRPANARPSTTTLLPMKLPKVISSLEKNGSVPAVSSYTRAKRGTT